MKSVGVAYFQKHCPELLAKLDAEGLVIHEDGKPIAKVIPHEEPSTSNRTTNGSGQS